MVLYLVQHGDALPKEVDPERPLSDRGRADVARLAAHLGAGRVQAASVIHSGKRRAGQTAEILAEAVSPGREPQAVTGLDPNDPVAPWAAGPALKTDGIMLVGHMPFMGRLAALLLTGDESRSVAAFKPGSILCLERSGEGGWAVAWMLRPELAA